MSLAFRPGAPATSKEAGPKPRATALRYYGDEFVFDTVSGVFYRMSPAACFLLHALDEGKSPQDLPPLLQREYQLDASTAVRDTELFLNDLAALEPLSRLNAK
ncbi:PqqD family protein [Ferrovibrio xuzhouensis]|uniref:PqqD family protein n=1 Tax=Ferrovibrio xuzhouensis TaxID=1576914 RepID=A0ABV7VDA7_9PROT